MTVGGMQHTNKMKAEQLPGQRLNFNLLSPERKLSVNSVNTTDLASLLKTSAAPVEAKVPVYLRIKPSISNGGEDSIIPVDNTRVKTPLQQEFTFTRVFSGNATQQEVFEEVARPTTDQFLLNGRDGLIFAYGVTNSGKTYTVQGTRKDPGIIPQVLDRIFQLKPAVFVSYLQIYNDQIQDLQDFTPPVANYCTGMESRRNLKVKVREDCVIVEALKETKIHTAEEGMQIVDRGNRDLRTNQDNGLNSSSSRSHTVFIVRLGQAKLHIVDLAGSERSKRTKLTGQRQLEASSINSSLSHLMGCLQAMRSNQKLAKLYPDKPQNKPPFRPIPFRECKLTLLFRDCLKASHGVVMIVNASPEALDFEETQHALRYGEMTRSTALMAEVPLNQNQVVIPTKQKIYGYDGRRTRRVAAAAPAPQVSVSVARPPPPKSQTPSMIRTQQILSPISKSASKIKIYFGTPVEEEEDEFELEVKRRLVQMECDLREELTKEMHQQKEEMERRYQVRMDRANKLEEEETTLLRAQTTAHFADIKMLTEQVRECEEEMNRMRDAHIREVEALQRELNLAKRAQGGGDPKIAKELEECRQRVEQLTRDLEEEMEAHSMVITDRCQISDELDRALEREEELKRKIRELEKQPTHVPFQLAGNAPNLLLSKRKQ